MASHQYPYGVDMPPEDFWNIAGRAGRMGQGDLGIVVLASDSEQRTAELRTFINQQAGDLNSALLQMAEDAKDLLSDLGRIVYLHPEWSSFLQYLAHTYQQMGKPATFGDEIERLHHHALATGRSHRFPPGDCVRDLRRIVKIDAAIAGRE